MTDLKLCPFCGGIPYTHIQKGEYSSSLTLVSCENANCPASCVHTSIETWNCRPPNKEHKELAIKLHKYGCTIATIYSLVKPLSETNGVCGAIAEAIETYTPKAVENSKIKGIENG